ncbi:MAG TPA: helix-turn-helix domain-containing protein [Kutzneria sp.]|jgi:predicted site-specific integrase-resolvase|nr:helix-turn-helix domain-containing protein [Kutzneria sp.]
MTQPTPLLTPSQVVERLAAAGVVVVEETVRDWARTGKIAAARLPSGRYLFRVEDIDAIAQPVEARGAA